MTTQVVRCPWCSYGLTVDPVRRVEISKHGKMHGEITNTRRTMRMHVEIVHGKTWAEFVHLKKERDHEN